MAVSISPAAGNGSLAASFHCYFFYLTARTFTAIIVRTGLVLGFFIAGAEPAQMHSLVCAAANVGLETGLFCALQLAELSPLYGG